MSELVYVNGALYHSDDMSDDYLAHYGVKGMKWGRRKLRAKNNKAWDRYTNESNRAAASYAGQVSKAKMLKKAGQIDRQTYKQKKNEAFDRFSSRESAAANRYRETVKRNKVERKNAIKANKQRLVSDAKKRSSESGKQYRKLLSTHYNAARANGASRTQAYLNTQTGRMSREMVYNR